MFYSIVNHFIAGQVLFYAIPGYYFDYIAQYLIFPLFTYLCFQACLVWRQSDIVSSTQQIEVKGDVQHLPSPRKRRSHVTPISTKLESSVQESVDDSILPDSPPLSNLSQELSFALQTSSEQDASSCSTFRPFDKTTEASQSDVVTEEYTVLSSQASTSVLEDNDSSSLSRSDSFTPRLRPTISTTTTTTKTSIETHINKVKETSRAYQIMLKQRRLSHQTESWRLFRTLYSFWKDTGHSKIPAHHLSTLLKSDSDSEPIDFVLTTSNASIIIDDAIQRSFPVQWTDSRYFVDFTAMIDSATSSVSHSSSSPHLLKRRASTLLG